MCVCLLIHTLKRTHTNARSIGRGHGIVPAGFVVNWFTIVPGKRMALFTAAEDELEYSYQPEEDEEYACRPSSESTEQEEDEEEYVCFPTHGITQQEEEEEMDEEQQVLCEGSLAFVIKGIPHCSSIQCFVDQFALCICELMETCLTFFFKTWHVSYRLWLSPAVVVLRVSVLSGLTTAWFIFLLI